MCISGAILFGSFLVIIVMPTSGENVVDHIVEKLKLTIEFKEYSTVFGMFVACCVAAERMGGLRPMILVCLLFVVVLGVSYVQTKHRPLLPTAQTATTTAPTTAQTTAQTIAPTTAQTTAQTATTTAPAAAQTTAQTAATTASTTPP